MSSAQDPIGRSDHRTRQRLLEAAVDSLASAGWRGSLLEGVAAAAHCPLDRARVFFGRDEELVLALYARLAADLEARVLELPEGTVAERFHAAMTAKFAIAEPYRGALAAVAAMLLDPRNELGALNPQTEIIRNRVRGVFATVVGGADDAPPAPADRLVRGLYGVHLGLMLLWCQDRSPETASARSALDLARDLLEFAVRLLTAGGATALTGRIDGLFQSLLDEPDDEPAKEQARLLLRVLFRHRRLLPDTRSCVEQPCEQCLALHLPRVAYFVRAGQPLHFLLPAFPAKSPSRQKTLGPLPDQAEACALVYLDAVCDELHALHPPGVRVTICSDGHVFGDLVGVRDDEVTAYGLELESMIHSLECRWLDTFSMANLYESLDYAAMRRHLIQQYAIPLEQVAERAHKFPQVRSLVSGIHRFLFEERVDAQPDRSRTQVRNECRGLAYQVVQRSDAWGRLLADCFPTALRLSIHPQHPHAEKVGILLGTADDAWLTPWHSAALRTATGWKFIKADKARGLGARLVERDGRPYHFEL